MTTMGEPLGIKEAIENLSRFTKTTASNDLIHHPDNVGKMDVISIRLGEIAAEIAANGEDSISDEVANEVAALISQALAILNATVQEHTTNAEANEANKQGAIIRQPLSKIVEELKKLREKRKEWVKKEKKTEEVIDALVKEDVANIWDNKKEIGEFKVEIRELLELEKDIFQQLRLLHLIARKRVWQIRRGLQGERLSDEKKVILQKMGELIVSSTPRGTESPYGGWGMLYLLSAYASDLKNEEILTKQINVFLDPAYLPQLVKGKFMQVKEREGKLEEILEKDTHVLDAIIWNAEEQIKLEMGWREILKKERDAVWTSRASAAQAASQPPVAPAQPTPQTNEANKFQSQENNGLFEVEYPVDDPDAKLFYDYQQGIKSIPFHYKLLRDLPSFKMEIIYDNYWKMQSRSRDLRSEITFEELLEFQKKKNLPHSLLGYLKPHVIMFALRYKIEQTGEWKVVTILRRVWVGPQGWRGRKGS